MPVVLLNFGRAEVVFMAGSTLRWDRLGIKSIADAPTAFVPADDRFTREGIS